MNTEEAGAYLLGSLPGYADYLTLPDEFPELLHTAMGDLGRYYMADVRENPDLVATYWSVVERLARDGDEAVTNAVHASLIEWFALGSHEEQQALYGAAGHQGPATAKIITNYRQD